MKKLFYLLIVLININSFDAQTSPTGLFVNDVAPDFSAINQSGKSINLKEQLKTGNVVLIFYRGEWCGYCNKQLKNLEDSLAQITKKGATVLAITPEKTENVTKTIEKTKVTFSILSDDNLKIMNAYKVTFSLDEKTTKKYKGYGIDLIESNGKNGNNLPVPAVYIINKEGKIIYRYFDEKYSNRVSVNEILSHL